MKRIPKALAGKPTLCRAWLWRQRNPEATIYDVGRAVSYRASDGWRIARDMKKLEVDEKDVVFVHPRVRFRQRAAILLYNLILEHAYKHGLPVLATSAELANDSSLAKQTVCSAMNALRENSVIDYQGHPEGMYIISIDYPLHAVQS